QYISAEIELGTYLGQGVGADKHRADLGQSAFIVVWEAFEQVLADYKLQHSVAEEFQSLVVGDARVFGGIRAVGQGLLEQSHASASNSEPLEELVQLFEALGRDSAGNHVQATERV